MIKTLIILLAILFAGYNLHAQLLVPASYKNEMATVFSTQKKKDPANCDCVKIFYLQYTVIQILVQSPPNELRPGYLEPEQVRDALFRTRLKPYHLLTPTVSKTNIIVYPGLLIW